MSETGTAGRLRSPSGEIIEYPDLPTVQEWIVLGRVGRGFRIYDAQNNRWRRVEKVEELLAFIHLREASGQWERAHDDYLASISAC